MFTAPKELKRPLNTFLFLYQQVLLSIQGMMFTPDPCFNEPGYEGIKGTDEGDVSSTKSNPKSPQRKYVVSYFADNRWQLKLCGNSLIV